jgi:hypothetical protein
MNRNVQHMTQPVVNKNWFINLHAEETSKTLNRGIVFREIINT